jgi:hypothetical protein
MTSSPHTTERADILETLTKHRELFRFTVQGLTDERASTRSTASELTLAGLIKHVTQVEKRWADFIVDGPADEPAVDWANIDWTNPPPEVLAYRNAFTMVEGETLAGLLEDYTAVASATDDLVGSVDLDETHLLPEAPWFTPGSSWTNRRVFLHVLAETTQHAGHADIIRESLDGQKSMG